MDFKKLIRYKTLDTCFRDTTRYYTKKDLVVAIEQAYKDMGYDADIKIRQLHYDLNFMQSSEGWDIALISDLKQGNQRIFRYEKTGFSYKKSTFFKKGTHQCSPRLVKHLKNTNLFFEFLTSVC